jgi:hypothetical protein
VIPLEVITESALPICLPLENLSFIVNPLVGDHPALTVRDAVLEVTREDRPIGEEHPTKSMWPPLTKFALVESALVVQRLQLA